MTGPLLSLSLSLSLFVYLSVYLLFSCQEGVFQKGTDRRRRARYLSRRPWRGCHVGEASVVIGASKGFAFSLHMLERGGRGFIKVVVKRSLSASGLFCLVDERSSREQVGRRRRRRRCWPTQRTCASTEMMLDEASQVILQRSTWHKRHRRRRSVSPGICADIRTPLYHSSFVIMAAVSARAAHHASKHRWR
ncbi:hypothetical protein LX36DRAFT_390767 [Colletotrichum falcatum]|nr:hypothetical protein LX36DRAFT_390767 [Colletotrichum falcatum]